MALKFFKELPFLHKLLHGVYRIAAYHVLDGAGIAVCHLAVHFEHVYKEVPDDVMFF